MSEDTHYRKVVKLHSCVMYLEFRNNSTRLLLFKIYDYYSKNLFTHWGYRSKNYLFRLFSFIITSKSDTQQAPNARYYFDKTASRPIQYYWTEYWARGRSHMDNINITDIHMVHLMCSYTRRYLEIEKQRCREIIRSSITFFA